LIRIPLLVASAFALCGCQALTTVTAPNMSGPEPFLASTEPANRGRDHFERGDYALAERSYRTAVERDPKDKSSWLGLAATYDQLGQFRLADRAYSGASKVPGDEFELLNNRGFSYMLRGNGIQASNLFARAKRIRPLDPVVNNNSNCPAT